MKLPLHGLYKSVGLRGILPSLRLRLWLADRYEGLRGPPLSKIEEWLLADTVEVTHGRG